MTCTFSTECTDKVYKNDLCKVHNERWESWSKRKGRSLSPTLPKDTKSSPSRKGKVQQKFTNTKAYEHIYGKPTGYFCVFTDEHIKQCPVQIPVTSTHSNVPRAHSDLSSKPLCSAGRD